MSTSSKRLAERRRLSALRKRLLCQSLGLKHPSHLKRLFTTRYDIIERRKQKENAVPIVLNLPPWKPPGQEVLIDTSTKLQPIAEEQPHLADDDDTPLEEKEYEGTGTFLKGTQSMNPHNDYSQHFVDTGERAQNFIQDAGLENRFKEYPKLRELIRLKDDVISKTNTPPMFLKADMRTFDLSDLENQFDVILVEPPLEEYRRSQGMVFDKYWSWDEIEKLEIDHICSHRSFCFIWCGSAFGLDRGRECLRRWGFRRCEDIIWIKTNKKNPGHNKNLEPRQVFQRTKEHCLMGIKGTVRRSLDGDFIHANVDIDLIIEEEYQWGSKEKPVEIFHIIEHFCLGRRRLHVFGRDSQIRPGWVTIGPEITSSNFDAEQYRKFFTKDGEEGYLTGTTEEIERLRPRSPPPSFGRPPPTIMELQEKPLPGTFRRRDRDDSFHGPPHPGRYAENRQRPGNPGEYHKDYDRDRRFRRDMHANRDNSSVNENA